MAMRGMGAFVSVAVFGVLLVKTCRADDTLTSELQFCSFFNNRAPTPQAGLTNCTWFKENSCCLQQEITHMFGKVKPLQGASLACQNHVNYLMCYICAPNQNIFYKTERLTVCEEFCNTWYHACGSAILKGSVIRALYGSGHDFCESRRFVVANRSCFNFDVVEDTNGSSGTFCLNILLLVLGLLVAYCLPEQWQEPAVAAPRINTSKCTRQVELPYSINAMSGRAVPWNTEEPGNLLRTKPMPSLDGCTTGHGGTPEFPWHTDCHFPGVTDSRPRNTWPLLQEQTSPGNTSNILPHRDSCPGFSGTVTRRC